MFLVRRKGESKTMHGVFFEWDLEMICLFCSPSVVCDPVTRVTRYIQLCGKEGKSVHVPKVTRKLLTVPSTQVRTCVWCVTTELLKLLGRFAEVRIQYTWNIRFRAKWKIINVVYLVIKLFNLCKSFFNAKLLKLILFC